MMCQRSWLPLMRRLASATAGGQLRVEFGPSLQLVGVSRGSRGADREHGISSARAAKAMYILGTILSLAVGNISSLSCEFILSLFLLLSSSSSCSCLRRVRLPFYTILPPCHHPWGSLPIFLGLHVVYSIFTIDSDITPTLTRGSMQTCMCVIYQLPELARNASSTLLPTHACRTLPPDLQGVSSLSVVGKV